MRSGSSPLQLLPCLIDSRRNLHSLNCLFALSLTSSRLSRPSRLPTLVLRAHIIPHLSIAGRSSFACSPMSSASSLAATVAQAVSFLTRPLAKSYASSTIMKLQLVLEPSLTALYAPSWDITDPTRGSGRRCLTLSPHCLPPRTVYAACIAAGVQWFDWIALLGGREFDFFVDPGCISMRLDRREQLITIWADEIPSPTVPKRCGESRIQASINQQVEARARAYAAEKQQRTKTVAQQLLEDDSESDEQIFTMIADEIYAPTWVTPILTEFPKPRSISPLSTISSHSRSSSRSSNSSSGFSFSSVESSPSSSASRSSSDNSAPPKQSRRERARQARVFVDTSKNEVTPYDGGKTTVLTGAVMLGCPTKKPVAAPRPDHAHGWRMRL
ncbi:Anti-prolifrtn domain-containing protein [Mycena sanguinolenta]|uniref:Anti-prolifrtn domain-containing protein n=1 Tax=Mycena sanguinolenta TaxID=230812 RepID=A0A8H6XER0_9AGAR|nr:Anti-prolifrtn domain-containing protein [Mycena sanguinolenta]